MGCLFNLLPGPLKVILFVFVGIPFLAWIAFVLLPIHPAAGNIIQSTPAPANLKEGILNRYCAWGYSQFHNNKADMAQRKANRLAAERGGQATVTYRVRGSDSSDDDRARGRAIMQSPACVNRDYEREPLKETGY